MKNFLSIVLFLLMHNIKLSSQDTCKFFAPQKEITDLNTNIKVPYDLICHVITYRKSKFWFYGQANPSTFIFISPRILIGAYHAIAEKTSIIDSIVIEIYAHEENGIPVMLNEIHFKKGEFTLQKPFSGRGTKNDCGIIILNKSVNLLPRSSFPKLISYDSARTISNSFNLSGYPYDKDIPEFNGSKLWERNISFQNVFTKDQIVYYPCVKAAEGDSGGPLWFIKDGQVFFLGTHVGGNEKNYNNLYGECLSNEKIKKIQKIIDMNQ